MIKSDIVYSPLTLNKEVKLLEEITWKELRDSYKVNYDIEIDSSLADNQTVQLYQCLSTGYQFFWPLHLAGNGDFYAHLQRFDWYYMPWKWEHDISLTYLRSSSKVLEIGCAKGDYLKMVQSKVRMAKGLELNPEAVKMAKSNRIDVELESIEQHAQSHPGFYDLVCSFQVVEHIAEIHSFLESSIYSLKKGGTLIVSVPNNGSFIKYEGLKNILNDPPHHMGRWDKDSLKNLTKIFPIQLLKLHYEPLQPHHFKWYYRVLLSRIANKKVLKIVDYFGARAINLYMKIFSYNIEGHTIMAVYKKL